jgi:hypothetical protein
MARHKKRYYYSGIIEKTIRELKETDGVAAESAGVPPACAYHRANR